MTEETVKVEVELPKNIHDATKVICDAFDYDMSEVVTWGLRGEIDSALNSNFEQFTDRIKARLKALVEEQP